MTVVSIKLLHLVKKKRNNTKKIRIAINEKFIKFIKIAVPI